MDKEFAIRHHLVLMKKSYLAIVEIIDRRSFAFSDIVEKTQPLEVVLGDQVSTIVFKIIQYNTNPIVLGLS